MLCDCTYTTFLKENIVDVEGISEVRDGVTGL